MLIGAAGSALGNKGVAENLTPGNARVSAHPEHGRESLEHALLDIAGITQRACDAQVVALSCAALGRATNIHAGEISAWSATVEWALAALANCQLNSEHNSQPTVSWIHLSPARLESISTQARRIQSEARIYAAGASCRDSAVKAVAVLTNDQRPDQTSSIA